MKIQLSFDDYCPENYKLADLLTKYGFVSKTIFFIECEIPDHFAQIMNLDGYGFEIGSHTITHPPDMKLLVPEVLRYEISGSKTKLEELIDKEIKWFCYPKGKYNKKVQEHVKLAGYEYARTVKVDHWHSPYKYEQNPTVHIYPRKEYKGLPWKMFAEKTLDKLAILEDPTFHLWGHAWEIEKFNYWEQLEEFLIHLNKYENTHSKSE